VSGPGLSAEEAARRLAADGPNELAAPPRQGWWGGLAEVLREPMLLLLLACAALYGLLGEPGDAVMLLVAVVAVIAITLVQQHRTEQALAALRQLAAPQALVWRDGRPQRVPARTLVVGDWIVLGEGERVPADARLREARLLQVDESLLSGESVPVAKQAGGADAEASTPIDQVFAGTLVTRGEGLAEVVATGPRSQMGRIGEALGQRQAGDSPLQREAQRLVRRMGVAAAAVCALLALGLWWSRGDWVQALLAGLSLAMGMLPEEVPVVLTVFMALGAWRMARQRVLTRRMPALEALGRASVLCVDKTGTLTENRMRVAALQLPGADALAPPAAVSDDPRLAALVQAARLATPEGSADPMELALRQLPAAPDEAGARLLREYPLAPELLAMSRLWQLADGRRALAAKGAPEAIAALCHLAPEPLRAVQAQVGALAAQGLRVLGVAAAWRDHADHAPADPAPADDGQHDYAFEWCGLVALADPLRAEVPDALAACARAGVRVLMITGDHPATARAIGRQAGLAADSVLTGAEIDALDDATLAARLAAVQVVARAVPAHKLRIVRALQAGGAVVGMTGDGVNDAPALQAADIGIAMGGRGTDVAREAADLVLADDDFAAIVDAVRMGRRLDHHLRRALGFVVSVHVPVAVLALLGGFGGWPLLLLPAHIALMELLIDPACSVVFELEPEDPAAMARPPRPPQAPLLDARLLLGALALGAVVATVVSAAAGGALAAGWGEAGTRGLAFTLLLASTLALVAAWLRPAGRAVAAVANRAWWPAVLTVLAAVGLLGAVAPVAQLFHLAPLPATGWGLVAGLALAQWLVLRWAAARVAGA
jgi:Ca2+-transporting ATPase